MVLRGCVIMKRFASLKNPFRVLSNHLEPGLKDSHDLFSDLDTIRIKMIMLHILDALRIER